MTAAEADAYVAVVYAAVFIIRAVYTPHPHRTRRQRQKR